MTKATSREGGAFDHDSAHSPELIEQPRKPSTVVKKAEPKKKKEDIEQFVDFNSGFDHGFGGLAEYKSNGSSE